MNKNTKILIAVLAVILIVFIIFATNNKKKKNENANNNTNSSEIQMKVEPDGEPSQEFVDNLKNPSFIDEHKNEILNILQ